MVCIGVNFVILLNVIVLIDVDFGVEVFDSCILSDVDLIDFGFVIVTCEYLMTLIYLRILLFVWCFSFGLINHWWRWFNYRVFRYFRRVLTFKAVWMIFKTWTDLLNCYFISHMRLPILKLLIIQESKASLRFSVV